MKGMYLGRRFYRKMFGLVIDTGTTIVGVTQLIQCEGVGVSFNGNRHDLDDLTHIVGPASANDLGLRGPHCDMSVAGAQCH